MLRRTHIEYAITNISAGKRPLSHKSSVSIKKIQSKPRE